MKNQKEKSIKEKIWDGIRFTLRWGYKICIAAAGATAFTNPISASITGGVAIASVISAAVKNKHIKGLMPLINIIACNFGKAANDPKVNR